MTVISSVSAITATSATINITGYGADGTIDVQVGPRPDFQFCVCPVFNVARAAAIAMPGLNQRGTYWVRARNRAASGAIEDWSAVEGFRTLDGAARVTTPAAIMIEPAMIVMPIVPIAVGATDAQAGFPVINAFRDSPVAWRAKANANNEFAIFVRTGGQPVDTVSLLNTNVPEGANLLISGGSTQANAEASADFQIIVPARASLNLPQRMGYHCLASLGAVRTSNWIRVLIQSATFAGSLLHVEHCVLGLNRVSKNHALEKSEQPSPMTTVDRKRSGIVDRVLGRPMRKVDFELQMLSEAQYETIYGDLWQRESDAALVVPNSKAGGFLHDRILFGDLSGGRIVNPSSPRYNRSITVTSII